MKRLRCVVPFCRRTALRRDAEWICPDHWRLVDRQLKLSRARTLRRWKRIGCEPATAEKVLWGYWRRMKRQAIERAAGIAA